MSDTMIPRLLILTRNLPPLVGGMERLNWHMAEELSKYAHVHVIGPQGSKSLCPPKVLCTEIPLQPLWRFLACSSVDALRVAKAWKPQVVLAGSGLMAPATLLAARAVDAKAGVYLHGLDAAVRHPIYRAIWHPAIRRMDTVIVNSKATAGLAGCIGVKQQQIATVHPGVQFPIERQPEHILHEFRQRHGLGSAQILLSIGRLTTRKGLREFVEMSLPAIVNERPGTLLVIIGDAPAHSLRATAQTRESIKAAADAAGVGECIKFLGIITDENELASAYECASLHVFPVRDLPGDPEGFGMVAIEAAAHGLPTVAFGTGGVVDAVAHGGSGYLVNPGDYESFSRRVLQVLNDSEDIWKETTRSFSEKFAWHSFGEKVYFSLQPGK